MKTQEGGSSASPGQADVKKSKHKRRSCEAAAKKKFGGKAKSKSKKHRG
jgi:hypothetical protein